MYTVTQDGQSTDVDGARPSSFFACSPLFSASNLDPNVSHTIRLSIKGPSPTRDMFRDSDPEGRDTLFGPVLACTGWVVYIHPHVLVGTLMGAHVPQSWAWVFPRAPPGSLVPHVTRYYVLEPYGRGGVAD
ncbi:hypothetical protein BDZ97DRAFT_326939 [Flammula alnicola]|nr:hypothetical protein BDZ97DRAFT_326939 [Flammula alnicola]